MDDTLCNASNLYNSTSTLSTLSLAQSAPALSLHKYIHLSLSPQSPVILPFRPCNAKALCKNDPLTHHQDQP